MSKPILRDRVELLKFVTNLILNKKEFFVNEIVYYIKTDEDFFNTFIESIKNNRRAVLLSAIRRILIESSQKISY